MSAEKCGGVLTPEILEAAAKRAVERPGELPQRIISPRAHNLLKRIQAKEPGWDRWSVAQEIYIKAWKLGLIDE